MLKKFAYIAIVGIFLGLATTTCSRSTPLGRQDTDGTPSKTEGPQKTKLQYLEVVTGAAEATGRWPTVVALHGLGDTPENFAELFTDYPGSARIVIPRAPLPYGPGFAWFLTRLSSGKMDTLGKEISHAAEQVISLIQALRTDKPPVVCGFSQGGMLSFAVAVLAPDTIAASIPISGLLPPSLLKSQGKVARARPMIHALHGESDTLIPLSHARLTVQQLQDLGHPADLQVFENTPHTVSPAMRMRLFTLLGRYLESRKLLQ